MTLIYGHEDFVLSGLSAYNLLQNKCNFQELAFLLEKSVPLTLLINSFFTSLHTVIYMTFKIARLRQYSISVSLTGFLRFPAKLYSIDSFSPLEILSDNIANPE